MSLRPARRVASVERTLIRRIFDAAPADAINLGLGQPDLASPAEVCLAGVAGIAEGRTGYSGTAGDPELRCAVAERYPGLAGGPDNVLISVGSQEALYVAVVTLVDPGREVLYPDTGYPAYPTVVRLAGGEPVAYPVGRAQGFRLAADEIVSRLSDRTALVILCAPANPTGLVPAAAELGRVVEACRSRGVPWVSDEVYAALTYDRPFVSPSALEPAGGVVVSSLSKELCMTGWRVGWLVGPTSIVERATAVHQHLVTCAPSISQRAALAAFGPDGRRARDRWVERLRERRALMDGLLERVPRVSYELPDGAFYFFVDVSAHGSSVDTARRLLSRCGVVTIPGEAFGEQGSGYLRLSFAAAEEDIERGLTAIARELAR